MPGGLYKAVYKQGGQGGHRLGWREVVTAPISGGITYHSARFEKFRPPSCMHVPLPQPATWLHRDLGFGYCLNFYWQRIDKSNFHWSELVLQGVSAPRDGKVPFAAIQQGVEGEYHRYCSFPPP